VQKLWIVYWEDDYDRERLAKEIQKYDITATFVCLRESYKARVKQFPNAPWQPFWEFSAKDAPEAYQRAGLERKVSSLGDSIERLEVEPQLYRTMGFNTRNSEFVECEHWGTIHFYTTGTRMNDGSIPSKLFMKPTGCKFYSGFFAIRSAFKVIKATPELKRLFEEFYFYEYDPKWHHGTVAKCFVCDFKTFSREKGERLYQRLDKLDYHLKAMTPPIIHQRHKRLVDDIIAERTT
jgi:hypothetical protein